MMGRGHRPVEGIDRLLEPVEDPAMDVKDVESG